MVGERKKRTDPNLDPVVATKFATEVSLKESLRLLRKLSRQTTLPDVAERYQSFMKPLQVVLKDVHASPPFVTRSGELKTPKGSDRVTHPNARVAQAADLPQ